MRSRSTKLVAAVLILGLALAPAAWAAPRAESAVGWAGVWAQVWSWVTGGWAKEGPDVHPDGLRTGSPGGDSLDEGPWVTPDG